MSAERAPYADVGAATRELIDRACRVTSPKLTGADWRVLLAIIAHLTTWSRLSDVIAVAQIASTANVGASTAGRSLRKLSGTCGLFAYNSRRGPGRPPLITLLTDQHASKSDVELTDLHASNSSAPLTDRHAGKSDGPSLAKNGPLTCQHVDQHPRRTREENDVAALLDDLELTAGQRQRALNADPDLVKAWLSVARTKGRNPEAFLDAGLQSGTWPTGHTRPDTRTPSEKACAIAASLGRNRAGFPEDEFLDELRYELNRRRDLTEGERDQAVSVGLESLRAATALSAADSPESAAPRAENSVRAPYARPLNSTADAGLRRDVGFAVPGCDR